MPEVEGWGLDKRHEIIGTPPGGGSAPKRILNCVRMCRWSMMTSGVGQTEDIEEEAGSRILVPEKKFRPSVVIGSAERPTRRERANWTAGTPGTCVFPESGFRRKD